MSIRALLIIFLSLFTVAGCATSYSQKPLTPTQQKAYSNMKVYYQGQTPSQQYKILSTVNQSAMLSNGLSQNQALTTNLRFNPEAINGLKHRAAELGADAIINVSCIYIQTGTRTQCSAQAAKFKS